MVELTLAEVLAMLIVINWLIQPDSVGGHKFQRMPGKEENVINPFGSLL
jgi:hypothetical protein